MEVSKQGSEITSQPADEVNEGLMGPSTIQLSLGSTSKSHDSREAYRPSEASISNVSFDLNLFQIETEDASPLVEGARDDDRLCITQILGVSTIANYYDG